MRIYIRPWGDDLNAGTLEFPVLTVAGAYALASDGDTLDVYGSCAMGAVSCTKSLTIEGRNVLQSELTVGADVQVGDAYTTCELKIRNLRLRAIVDLPDVLFEIADNSSLEFNRCVLSFLGTTEQGIVSGAVKLTQCTVHSRSGQGTAFYEGNPEIQNSIIAGFEIGYEGSGDSEIHSSGNCWFNDKNFLNADSGITDIQADPMLANPSDLDYRLQQFSPCINRGLDLGETDYTGSVPDIGALEFVANRQEAYTTFYNWLFLLWVMNRSLQGVSDDLDLVSQNRFLETADIFTLRTKYAPLAGVFRPASMSIEEFRSFLRAIFLHWRQAPARVLLDYVISSLFDADYRETDYFRYRRWELGKNLKLFTGRGSSQYQITDSGSPSYLRTRLKAETVQPAIVGTCLTNQPWGVFVVGNYAYVADSSAGLRIIDITDPETPSIVGTYNTPGSARGVFVLGNYAYVADLSGLIILNISDPTNPIFVGYYDTPGDCYSVFVVGNYAYCGSSYNLKIVNISNPASPALVGTCLLPNYVRGVFVLGNYAYVADYSAGLKIVNISNPASPTLVGTYYIPGACWDVYVVGNYAYVAYGVAGLLILNISDPTNPILVGTCDLYNSRGVFVVGDYAYVADDDFVRTVDISDPTNPILHGTCATIYAHGVYARGNYAYVADNSVGLRIIKFYPVGRNTKYSQEFEVPASATFYQANIRVYTELDNGSRKIQGSLYLADAQHKPTGNVLGVTGEIYIPSGAEEVIILSLPFSTPPTVNETKYCFVTQMSGYTPPDYPYIDLAMGSGNPYPDGRFFYYDDIYEAWLEMVDNDLYFDFFFNYLIVPNQWTVRWEASLVNLNRQWYRLKADSLTFDSPPGPTSRWLYLDGTEDDDRYAIVIVEEDPTQIPAGALVMGRVDYDATGVTAIIGCQFLGVDSIINTKETLGNGMELTINAEYFSIFDTDDETVRLLRQLLPTILAAHNLVYAKFTGDTYFWKARAS